MPMQRYKPEQIVTVLRQIEVAVAHGGVEVRYAYRISEQIVVHVGSSRLRPRPYLQGVVR